MSRRDDRISLADMLDHAVEAVHLVENKDKDAFSKDRVLQLALTHLVEIIGEAANRISTNTQEKYPQIPWLQIIGMRNRLAHGYDVIDYDLLWDTVTNDLPSLIMALKEIVEDS